MNVLNTRRATCSHWKTRACKLVASNALVAIFSTLQLRTSLHWNLGLASPKYCAPSGPDPQRSLACCGRCLCPHADPEAGRRQHVFCAKVGEASQVHPSRSVHTSCMHASCHVPGPGIVEQSARMSLHNSSFCRTGVGQQTGTTKPECNGLLSCTVAAEHAQRLRMLVVSTCQTSTDVSLLHLPDLVVVLLH